MPTWQGDQQFCIGDRKKSINHCVNWDSGKVDSCKNSAPSNVIGWESCGLGSSPWGKYPGFGAMACSGRTNEFSCKWGQECYAHTRDDYDPTCDQTVFQDQRTACWGNDKITFRKCDNWANNDPKSCERSSGKAGNVIGWIKCGIGSSPGGVEPGHNATVCSPMSTTNNCAIGQNCFAVTDIKENECNTTTFLDPRVTCWDDSEITFQKCDNWANNDPNSCLSTANAKIGNVQGWITCGIGSSPGGKEPGHTATACSPISDKCVWGQNCFAITNKNTQSNTCNAKFGSTVKACGGQEQGLTFNQCTDWKNPNECNTSINKPANVIEWQKCAIGSSPGGAQPGHHALLCSEPTTNFDCAIGQNCFAITSRYTDTACKDPTDIFGIKSLFGNFKLYFIIAIITLLCCSSSFSFIRFM